MEEEMLLSANEEITVTSGFRLFDYVSVRIDLQTMRGADLPPSPDSTIFAVITLGDLGSGQPPIRTETNAFSLSDIPDYVELYQKWGKLVGAGRIEYRFLEFLLSHLRGNPEVRLDFSVQEGQIKKFGVRLGNHVQLFGRFPVDEDVLSRYFSVVETVQD